MASLSLFGFWLYSCHNWVLEGERTDLASWSTGCDPKVGNKLSISDELPLGLLCRTGYPQTCDPPASYSWSNVLRDGHPHTQPSGMF